MASSSKKAAQRAVRYLVRAIVGSGISLLYFSGAPIAGTLMAGVFIAMEVGAATAPQFLLRYKAKTLAGLSFVYPIAPLRPGLQTTEESTRAAKAARQSLCRAVDKSNQIQLLLASGYEVIGHPQKPGWLHNTLRNTDKSGALEVLLLDPVSPAATARAAEVMPSYGAENYTEGTKAVLFQLRRWSDDLGIPITVRLYVEEPIWQMILLPKELFLLSAADGRASGTSPMFTFRRDQDYGLAWGLEAVWRRRWDLTTTTDVVLSEVEPPDWSKVIDAKQTAWESD